MRYIICKNIILNSNLASSDVYFLTEENFYIMTTKADNPIILQIFRYYEFF